MTREQAQQVAAGYLESQGFKYVNERGEMVWRKGFGWLAAPQFIKAEAEADGTVRVEAWLAQLALLPGIYFGEMDPMVGAFGFAVKALLKPKVHELEGLLGGQSVPATPRAGWYTDPTGRHQQRYWDGLKWTENVSDQGQSGIDAEGVA